MAGQRTTPPRVAKQAAKESSAKKMGAQPSSSSKPVAEVPSSTSSSVSAKPVAEVPSSRSSSVPAKPVAEVPSSTFSSVPAKPVAEPSSSNDFPTGECGLGKYCLAPHHQLRKKCPGCNNWVHMVCGRVLVNPEGALIDGKTAWYPADAVVCLSCDPKNPGTERISAGDDDGSSSTIESCADSNTDVDGGEENESDDGEAATENVDGGEEENDDIGDGQVPTEHLQRDAGQNGEGVTHPKKCSYCKCAQKEHHNWPLVACANPTCKKMIHELCFAHFLSVTHLPHAVKDGTICCATIRCCAKFKAQSSERVRWDSDGPNGPNTIPNSQSIILEWWTTGDNYHQFKGGKDSNGKISGNKKSNVWQQLSDEIKKQKEHHIMWV